MKVRSHQCQVAPTRVQTSTPSLGKRNLFAAQSRGNKLKQVLAEYGGRVTTAIPVGYQHIEKLLQEFPKGTNVIHKGTFRSSHSCDPKGPSGLP